MPHVDNMLKLTQLDSECDDVQAAIDYARQHFGASDQIAQLLLDDKQTELTAKRSLIREIMADIAATN